MATIPLSGLESLEERRTVARVPVTDPLPNSPLELLPQHVTLPAEVTAQVCSNPADSWAYIGRRRPSLASLRAGNSRTIVDQAAATIKAVIIVTKRRAARLLGLATTLSLGT